MSLGPFASPFFRNEMLTLVDLPLDIIIQILKFARGTDIFSFSRTCKKCLEITLTRTVWMNAVRRMCEINNVFEPSFPLDDMSLLELQYAATSGAAWFATRLNVQKSDTTSASLEPLVRRIFSPRMVKTSDVAADKLGVVQKLVLVPGGRFLLIGTDHLVHLWDLGHGAGKLIKPHALASVALPVPGSDPYISILPAADGVGIEVMIRSYNRDAKSSTLMVYRIFPSDRHPEFISITEPFTFTHASTISGFLAKPGYCILHSAHLIFFWDAARNLWTTWKAEQSLKRVFVYEDVIVGVSATTIAIWEMPTPHSDVMATSGVAHRAILTLMHPFPNVDLEISTSANWLSTAGQPFFLFITASRYIMQSLDRSANCNLPPSLPILMDTVLISPPVDGPSPGEIQVCGETLFSLWSSPATPKIEVHVSPMPKQRKETGPPFIPLCLFEDEWGTTSQDPTPFDFSLCPVTGRLCMTVRENEILVLDFLIPN
ncbi:hypothetical protein FB451DRAFT_1300792 [Mycena latifolia]|nr:hypothetical protein FB451DRAFT_1300792 [Mycena latifolia]